MSVQEDFGKQAYLDIADELTWLPGEQPVTYRAWDFDSKWVAAAMAYARARQLPYPPPDIDRALDLVRSDERS